MHHSADNERTFHLDESLSLLRVYALDTWIIGILAQPGYGRYAGFQITEKPTSNTGIKLCMTTQIRRHQTEAVRVRMPPVTGLEGKR
jgi:hypothetical protein